MFTKFIDLNPRSTKTKHVLAQREAHAFAVILCALMAIGFLYR